MQNIGLNNIYAKQTSFGSSVTKPEEQAPAPEHKNHDGGLILGVLGATAATVGAIALIKKGKGVKDTEKVASEAIKKLEKAVFEPLKDFQGTKAEFTQKAYGLLVKHKGIEDIAPELRIIPMVQGIEDMTRMGQFQHAAGKLDIGSDTIEGFTHGDIVGMLSHELEHFQQYSDIASLKGIDGLSGSLREEFKNVFNNPVVLNSAATLMDEFVGIIAHCETLDKEGIQKFFKEEGLEPLTKVIFKDGLDNLSKEEIMPKLHEHLEEQKRSLLPENIEQGANNEFDAMFNKVFWEKVIAKRGKTTPEQLTYGAAPYLKRFEEGRQIAPATGHVYYTYKAQKIYHADPFEKAAFDVQRQTVNAWNEFLTKNKIEAPKAVFKDERPVLAAFDKIDTHLQGLFPAEESRANALGVLVRQASLDTKSEEAGPIFDVINKELSSPKSSYHEILNIFGKINSHLQGAPEEQLAEFQRMAGEAEVANSQGTTTDILNAVLKKLQPSDAP